MASQPALYDQDVKALFDKARLLNDRPRVDELLVAIEAWCLELAKRYDGSQRSSGEIWRERDEAVEQLRKSLAREQVLRVQLARELREAYDKGFKDGAAFARPYSGEKT